MPITNEKASAPSNSTPINVDFLLQPTDTNILNVGSNSLADEGFNLSIGTNSNSNNSLGDVGRFDGFSIRVDAVQSRDGKE